MQKKRKILVSLDVWDILRRLRLPSRNLLGLSTGQTLIEGTFSVIVIVMLLFAMIRVFFWVGEDLSSRAAAHERTLVEGVMTSDIDENYRQIRPTFYEGTPMDAATVNSAIFGSNRFR